MKSKKWFLFVIVFILIGCGMLLKPLGIISKDESEFIFEDNAVLSDFEDATFFVEITDDVGYSYNVNVRLVGDNHKYIGTAFLPGNIDPAECKLSWQSDKDIKIIKRMKKYSSGEYALAGEGYNSIFVLESGGQKYDFMIKSMVGSSDIEPLLISIDEAMGTIAEMNEDWNHNNNCYGVAYFNKENHYISIKGRGNASWHYCPKKPYNISYLKEDYDGKESVSMVENTEAKKWSILANYGDPSLLRNKIGFDLAEKMGIGLPSEYYDVWMNGDYLGNYLVTPKNDYKAAKNGFILELDNYIDEEDPQFYLCNDNGQINSLLFTVKDDSADLGVEEINEWMQNAWNAIIDYSSEDYLEYIDLDTWSKMYLFHEIVKNYDVVNGSILMHRDGTSIDDKLKAGPIWDLDNAFGTTNWNILNGMDFETALSADKPYIDSISLTDNNFCWLQELGKHESFMNNVKHVYSDYEGEIKNLLKCVDDTELILGSSALMNSEKWGTTNLEYNNFDLDEYLEFNNNPYPFTYVKPVDYYDYVVNLRFYIEKRTECVSDLFALK